MADPAAPVQRFSPAPAIWVDRTERSYAITGQMEMSGPEATADRARSAQDSINSTWTKTFSDEYKVTCNITIRFRGPGTPAGNVTQIQADKMSGPSNVALSWLFVGSRVMYLNANESGAFDWTPAHEFGHVLGLEDRYTESIVSKIAGKFGGDRSTPPMPGYEGNLMAKHQGMIESKNVRDLGAENEPSPWWINSDDQVRDWVNSHALSDITALSGANKLKAIHTLMDSWISDSDLQAIKRICASVTTVEDAKILRDGVDTLDFTDIGQRLTVRVAFAKMPQ